MLRCIRLGQDNTKSTKSESSLDRQVAGYLAANPDFLEKYVLNHVDLETLERWTIRRARRLRTQQAGRGGEFFMNLIVTLIPFLLKEYDVIMMFIFASSHPEIPAFLI